ncbi:hypothetical protein V6Z12_D05G319500 [Gossypium hirsutum]
MTKVKSTGGIGFRDLNLFNISLLAKQCWKLLQSPKDLWARVLEGEYFPKGAFLNTKQGSRASWVWASLLQGREFLKKMCSGKFLMDWISTYGETSGFQGSC